MSDALHGSFTVFRSPVRVTTACRAPRKRLRLPAGKIKIWHVRALFFISTSNYIGNPTSTRRRDSNPSSANLALPKRRSKFWTLAHTLQRSKGCRRSRNHPPTCTASPSSADHLPSSLALGTAAAGLNQHIVLHTSCIALDASGLEEKLRMERDNPNGKASSSTSSQQGVTLRHFLLLLNPCTPTAD